MTDRHDDEVEVKYNSDNDTETESIDDSNDLTHSLQPDPDDDEVDDHFIASDSGNSIDSVKKTD